MKTNITFHKNTKILASKKDIESAIDRYLKEHGFHCKSGGLDNWYEFEELDGDYFILWCPGCYARSKNLLYLLIEDGYLNDGEYHIQQTDF